MSRLCLVAVEGWTRHRQAPLDREGGGRLGRLGRRLSRRRRKRDRVDAVRPGRALPARMGAARWPAVRGRSARHVRVPRRAGEPLVLQSLFLAAIGDARDKRAKALETFAYRYPEGVSGHDRFLVHRTVFPRDFLSDFGFQTVRTQGRVELARLDLGGLQPVARAAGRMSSSWSRKRSSRLPRLCLRARSTGTHSARFCHPCVRNFSLGSTWGGGLGYLRRGGRCEWGQVLGCAIRGGEIPTEDLTPCGANRSELGVYAG